MNKNIVRARCSQSCWMILIYYFLMSSLVFLFRYIVPENGSYNGVAYLLAIIVAFVVLMHWPQSKIPFEQYWGQNRQMKPYNGFLILCSVAVCQVFFQLLCFLWNNEFVTQANENMVDIDIFHQNSAMLVYIGIAAPVFEEILFRCFVLRVLRPYGKCFAIVSSSFLFGIFHGNILQSPFAFAIGLVLGYTAVEFSLKWAVLVHIFNNLVLSIGFAYLSDIIGLDIANWIYTILIYGGALVAVTVLLCKCSALLKYWKESDRQQTSVYCFLTSPGIMLFTALMVLIIVLSAIKA